MTGRYLAARPPPKNPLTLDTPQPQFPTTTRLEVRRNSAQTQQIAMSSSFATSLGDVSGNQQLHQHQPAWSPSSGFPADELQPAYFDPSRPSGITLTSPTAPTTPGQYNLSINTAEHPSPASGRNPPQRPTPGPPDDYDIGYQALHRPPISEPSLTEEHISGWRYGVPSPSMANFPSLARPHAENEPSSSSAYRPPPSSTTTRPHPSRPTDSTGGRGQQNSLLWRFQPGTSSDEDIRRRRRLDPRPPTQGEVTTPQQSLNPNPTTPGGVQPTAPTPNIGNQATDDTSRSEQTQEGHLSEF